MWSSVFNEFLNRNVSGAEAFLFCSSLLYCGYSILIFIASAPLRYAHQTAKPNSLLTPPRLKRLPCFLLALSRYSYSSLFSRSMQVCVTFYLSLNRSKIKKKLWILRLWLDRVSNRSKVIVTSFSSLLRLYFIGECQKCTKSCLVNFTGLKLSASSGKGN